MAEAGELRSKRMMKKAKIAAIGLERTAILLL